MRGTVPQIGNPGIRNFSAFLSMMNVQSTLLNTLPTAHIPPAYRAAFAGRERARWHEEPRMAAYPNPAKDRVMITLPEGVDHGELQVFDAQGRLVHAVSLLQAKAFVELDARSWTEGLYLAKLTFEGYDAGECKFTVVR